MPCTRYYEYVADFVTVSGPLYNATVVVATEPPNDKGLPHTLEHLVFMVNNVAK